MQKNISFVLLMSLIVMFLFVPTSDTFASEKKVVNINTASAEELTTLKGIGKKTAQKIIDYRKANGPFQNTADVMNVKGIGEKTYNGFKNQITVGSAKSSTGKKVEEKKGTSKKSDVKKTTKDKSTK